MTDERACGTCRYNRFLASKTEFVCANEDSEAFGLPTFYDDECAEWEEKG